LDIVSAAGKAPLNVKIGTTDVLSVNSSGNVGIGTNNPTVALDVVGSVRCTAGYNLNYTSPPTYTSNQIGFTSSGGFTGVTPFNSVGGTVTIITPGVYLFYWNIAGSNTSAASVLETWVTDVSTSIQSNATIDGVTVGAYWIHVPSTNSSGQYFGGSSNIRILKPASLNKEYYVKATLVPNTVSGQYFSLTYYYIRIA
jgi:hypothetical protein